MAARGSSLLVVAALALLLTQVRDCLFGSGSGRSWLVCRTPLQAIAAYAKPACWQQRPKGIDRSIGSRTFPHDSVGIKIDCLNLHVQNLTGSGLRAARPERPPAAAALVVYGAQPPPGPPQQQPALSHRDATATGVPHYSWIAGGVL